MMTWSLIRVSLTLHEPLSHVKSQPLASCFTLFTKVSKDSDGSCLRV